MSLIDNTNKLQEISTILARKGKETGYDNGYNNGRNFILNQTPAPLLAQAGNGLKIYDLDDPSQYYYDEATFSTSASDEMQLKQYKDQFTYSTTSNAQEKTITIYWNNSGAFRQNVLFSVNAYYNDTGGNYETEQFYVSTNLTKNGNTNLNLGTNATLENLSVSTNIIGRRFILEEDIECATY